MIFNKLEAQAYVFTAYTTKEGLINSRCASALQDGAGYLWVGTDDGICRYDGKTFKYYPINHTGSRYFAGNFAKCINDTVFITLVNGIAVCHGNYFKYITKQTELITNFNDAIKLGRDSFLMADMTNGLTLLAHGKCRVIMPPALRSKITKGLFLLKDKYCNIWFGTDNGLFVFKKGNLSSAEEIPAFKRKYISFLCTAGNSIKVVTTESLSEVNQKQNSFSVKKIFDIKTSVVFKEALTSYYKDRTGNEWMGAFDCIFFRHKDSISFTKLNTGAYTTGATWYISEDREENIWLAADNGLFKLPHTEIRIIDIANNYFAPLINGSILSGKELLFTNYINLYGYSRQNGLKEYEGASLKKIQFTRDKFFPAGNNMVWASHYPLNSFNAQSVHYSVFTTGSGNSIQRKPLPALDKEKPDLNTASFDNRNHSFIVANNQLCELQNGMFKPVSLKHNLSQPIKPVKLFFSKQDLLWIADATNGLLLCRIRWSNDEPVAEVLQVYNQMDYSWFNDKIDITADNAGHIWMGERNSGGLYCFTLNKNGLIQSHKILQSPQLSSNSIFCVTVDSISGHIWAGTSMGIDIINPLQSDSLLIYKNYYGAEVRSRSIYFLNQQDNTMYAGTDGSLIIIEINNRKKNTAAPPVYIQQVIINGHADSAYQNKSHLSLNWEQRNISFSFAGLSFKDENAVRYKYMLEGADKTWSSPAAERSISYSNLAPGAYTFKVMACNNDGVWSTAAAIKEFTIAKPWYKTNLFLIASFLLLCGAAYVLYNYRLRKALEVQQVRQRISADLHDDIGSALSSITMMSMAAKHKAVKDQQQTVLLTEKIEQTSRQMIQNLNDIIWSVRPGNDSLEQTINRLRDYMTDVLTSKDIAFTIDIADALNNLELPPEMRRDLYLVCKEIINNAAKYSGAKNFLMRLVKENKTLHVVLNDDGNGFEKDKAAKGNGLGNIKKRISKHEGKAILQADERGTRWYISLHV